MDDDLKSNIKNLLRKCELLENFCDLHLRRDALQIDLKEFREECKEVKDILMETNRLYEIKLPNLRRQYDELIEKVKNQHITVLNLVAERNRQKIQSNHTLRMKENSAQSLITPLKLKNLGNEVTTPRMYLSEYINSPFIKKSIRSIAIQFINFDFKINSDAFEAIPKYMKGRETLTELQHFLDEIVTASFNEKYQLLVKSKECIRNANELKTWRIYKTQSALFPPKKYFVSQEDLARKLNKPQIDRNSLSKLTMLRHLAVIHAEQKEQTVFYIWVENRS